MFPSIFDIVVPHRLVGCQDLVGTASPIEQGQSGAG